ncbi:hypothetical protein C5167_030708 [Papaver somniferum]|nr:hypothetical protein C5167_030708 [Papaver somniferum]
MKMMKKKRTEKNVATKTRRKQISNLADIVLGLDSLEQLNHIWLVMDPPPAFQVADLAEASKNFRTIACNIQETL